MNKDSFTDLLNFAEDIAVAFGEEYEREDSDRRWDYVFAAKNLLEKFEITKLPDPPMTKKPLKK